MLTALDRLTIYSVLCFISFCALVLRTPADTSLMPLVGMVATIIGIWIEMRKWSGASEQEN
ncbi:hypothetical protein ND926_03440 [Vibrio diabolicus]|jgi:hypothetical protein|uniref:Uncharacterized protein n=3 Tax=Vibrio TaxID=662 RepID=A0AAQ2J4N3_9VIBR|nr:MULTISPECIES: hypothetical protein [Vibrio]KOY46521.1 hypothetical protein ACX03_05890 [Vibrio parahaemolyticus]MCR9496290.1 hypothetical protein [Vibrio alginolyticus]MEA3484909.1 hypothetical protein [Pseudomonadota bacterium]GAJ78584.1 hypothetical protein JCM18905_4557 [Vibrio sp. JCM 18905]ACY50155.1 hypothetical protein VEA_001992 [Vibrio antiquarius]